MRKIWYLVIAVGLTIMTFVFTSGHARNVDNAWLISSLLDHGNIIMDLVTLYIAHRVFNSIRTHEICQAERNPDDPDDKSIGPLCVGIMAAWVLAIAIVVSQ